MKILLANYRYFISGGPERYLFNISKTLENRGHEVIPFSIKYTRNQPTPYSKYFVSPLGNENEVYFKNQNKGLRTLWKTAKRLFYDKEVELAVQRIVSDTKPDIVYILHYLRKLSPALLVGIKKMGIPIVIRLSDYAMLCPQAHFFRNEKVCELCLKKGLFNSVRYKCVQNSYPMSLLNYGATMFHQSKKYFDLIDCFVVTNEFMYKKMIEAGYSRDKLRVIPTFVNQEDFKVLNEKEKGLIIYVGRLEEIKGVHVLINALNQLKNRYPEIEFQAKILGSGSEAYTQRIQDLIVNCNLQDSVKLYGNKTLPEIIQYLSCAQVSIVPSLWYENLPNVILESYASGTAVVASNLGSIPQVVIHEKTGFLFEPGNPDDLAERVAYCLSNPDEMVVIGNNNRLFVERQYSKEKHLNALKELFGELI
jgi:glycosyltransferase involved in cell wall biosynthesis